LGRQIDVADQEAVATGYLRSTPPLPRPGSRLKTYHAWRDDYGPAL